MPKITTGFCIQCGQATEIDLDGPRHNCPMCDAGENWLYFDQNQVNVSINWFELQILCIWAERWAHEKLGGAGTIYSIAERIGKQTPGRDSRTLTLAGQINQVKDEYGDVDTNIPGVG